MTEASIASNTQPRSQYKDDTSNYTREYSNDDSVRLRKVAGRRRRRNRSAGDSIVVDSNKSINYNHDHKERNPSYV